MHKKLLARKNISLMQQSVSVKVTLVLDLTCTHFYTKKDSKPISKEVVNKVKKAFIGS